VHAEAHLLANRQARAVQQAGYLLYRLHKSTVVRDGLVAMQLPQRWARKSSSQEKAVESTKQKEEKT
jgi:hypothetical protein